MSQLDIFSTLLPYMAQQVGMNPSRGQFLTRVAPTQTVPAEASNSTTPESSQGLNFDNVIAELDKINKYNAQQGASMQDAAQQKLGIGKYEEGHPIRAGRHALENLAGVLFELHGRRAPWYEERMNVMSPDYPRQAVQQQQQGLGGFEAMSRLQELKNQHLLMNQIQQGNLGTKEGALKEKIQHDTATEGLGHEKVGLAQQSLQQKKEEFERTYRFKQASTMAELQEKFAKAKASLLGSMASDDDKQTGMDALQQSFEEAMQTMGQGQKQVPSGAGNSGKKFKYIEGQGLVPAQ